MLDRKFVPESVLEAFHAAEAPARLAGGQGGTFRSGDLILKAVALEPEAQLTAELFEAVEGPGFRVPRPVRSVDGQFVVEGWCAWEWVDAQPAGRNGGRWDETFAACRAFHAALASFDGAPWRDVFRQRTDPWSEADRLAFGEAGAEPLPEFASLLARMIAGLRPVEARDQLIHGDFTANVLFADDEPPWVIDFSPYWRPAEFAMGVVLADAVSWAGAGRAVLLLAGIPDAEQWALRGLLRRVWEAERHTRRGRDSREHVKTFERAFATLR